MSLTISLFGGIILTGDPVSTMNFFLVPSIFIVIVIWFLRSVKCFVLVSIIIDLSVSFSSVSAVSVSSLISCRFCFSSLHVFTKWFFLDLWHNTSRAGHLWFRLQFGASQNLQFWSLCLSFDLVRFCPVYDILCIGSSLVSFSRFDIRASGMVFFLFFRSYVFCCICSTTFAKSKSFSSSSSSRIVLFVVDVIKIDKSNLVLNSGK